ncbi:hypothetical protein LSPH24S_09992 [Lysinibacillus sphaericus]
METFIQPYTNYTVAFKMDVLNFMIEKGTSLNETAAIFKIPAPSTISAWRKQYETQGLDALHVSNQKLIQYDLNRAVYFCLLFHHACPSKIQIL